VITDENPFSINDPVFDMAMGAPDADGNATSTVFVDIPASYHNGAVTISFADGHSVAMIAKLCDFPHMAVGK